MIKRFNFLLLLGITAMCLVTNINADVNYPACTGTWPTDDCSPQCGKNCAPPPIPCPQMGPVWCGGN